MVALGSMDSTPEASCGGDRVASHGAAPEDRRAGRKRVGIFQIRVYMGQEGMLAKWLELETDLIHHLGVDVAVAVAVSTSRASPPTASLRGRRQEAPPADFEDDDAVAAW
ncbi:hypothetical protein GUJ93_ZPchr0004g39768 [Zizania palustris]|uniref:Uncharacterized protein n=1 Tax=Zizania palustris TaxID=103762 RepID=A0A8J5SXL4_ZIZPA|nr:hypothetical protein GUJ93_ZPchr0004g39768 [Zizania palustris]